MLELNGTELALIVAAIALASGLLSSVVVRSGTRYAARLNGRQRATEEELRILWEVQEALVTAASLGSVYVLNIADIPTDSNGQAEWTARRPLLEPFLTAASRVPPLLATVQSAKVRETVNRALLVLRSTMQPNASDGQKAWRDANGTKGGIVPVGGDEGGILTDAVIAIGAERRRLLDQYPSK